MTDIPVTHPESAWLAAAVTPALVAAALIVAGLLLRGPLAVLLATVQARRVARGLPDSAAHDPALVWSPAILPPEQFVLLCLSGVALVAAALSLVLPPALAILAGAPAMLLLGWLLLVVAERRYVASLERDLTAAVGRLGALLRANSGLRPALERVTIGLPEGPLRDEWSYLLTRQGAPLAGGSIATPQQVLRALADQTLSRRHGVFLNHLAAAAGQPQEAIVRRCEGAYVALQASERRRDEAATELAQVRYSGIAVGLAGVTMAAYLTWTQWERVVAAYSSPLGLLVGPIVLAALALPVVGGLLLARVEDADY